MTDGTGLLAVWMQIPPELEEDLINWYKQEHLPERIGIPGFLSALRYLSLEGEPKFMALYDLTSPDVLYSEAYKDLRRNSTDWTRRIGRALEKNVRHEYILLGAAGDAPSEPAPNVLLVRLGSESDDDLSGWLKTRLLPAMAKVPGVQRTRLFEAVVGTPKYLLYYELSGPRVTDSDAWKQSEVEAGLPQMNPKLDALSTNFGEFIEAAQFDKGDVN